MVRRKGFLTVMAFVVLLIGFDMLGNNAMGGWITEKVADGLKNECFYQRGIVVDDYGHPHIAFGGDRLYYVYHDGNDWCLETQVDSLSSEVKYVSMARDSENNMHITYCDAAGKSGNQDLGYAVNDSGLWQSTIVNTTVSGGKYVSIAIDSNKKAHISYYDNQDLWYATNVSVSDTWETELIDKNTGLYTSIALDSSNKVHISYYDESYQDLKYITGSLGSWQLNTLDSKGNVGQYTSLALDSNNKVHISYYDADNQNLRYATNASGSWKTEIVDDSESVGEYTSLALDSNNTVHISYYDAGNHNLKYAAGVLGKWQTETVDSGVDVGKYTSLAVCSSNKVHISYYDADNKAQKYAAKSINIENRPPEFLTIGSQTVKEGVVIAFTINEGELLKFTIAATDPDIGNVLTYSADYDTCYGADFDPNTLIFSWIPGYGDAGKHEVIFTVTDNGEPFESDSEEITIIVKDFNRPPVLAQINAQTIHVGSLLEFTIEEATDPDEDNLTYSIDSPSPNGASFDPNTLIFSWTPEYGAAGKHEVKFTVTDDGAPPKSDSQAVGISVTLQQNDKPYPPTLFYPDSNQCDVSLTPELQTGDFSGPDNYVHAQTQWQIFRKDDNLRILDITSSSCLTKLVVSESVLDEGTSYYWQARFYDNQSISDWSNRYSFTTFSTNNDKDSNGVPDDQELAFEIDDMDNDNGSDRLQSDIKCVNTEVGNGQIGVSIKDSPDIISIESIKSIDPAAISGNNKPDNLPLGLISFKVKVNNTDDVVEVTLYLFPPAPYGAKWYKYDPMNGWRVYPYAVFSDDGTSVTLQLKDGDMDYGDVDGTKNGIIIDPSGLVGSSIPDTQDTQEEGINSSEGGGCFIATTAYRVSKINVSKFLPEKQISSQLK